MTYTTGDTLLNKYRIERLLGRGGFAEVYLAAHLELHAPRALKVLRKNIPGLGSSDVLAFDERFELEARLGAMFDHPNLVRVYDFERDAETLILVMEYCPGGSLADRLREHKVKRENLALEPALQIGLEISRGLEALHQMDLVHRDLKPSNILFDSQGRAKVSDLGLAQTPGGLSIRDLLGSLSPKHPGTPGYMSPEQENQTNYLRPASDVYALGVVLFEALTGRMLQNLKPGTRLQSLRPDAPGWLDELLAQILHKDPEQRPWDGAEVVKLLEQGLKEQAQRQRAGIERAAAEEKAQKEARRQEEAEAEQRKQQEAEAEQRRQQEAEAEQRRQQEARAEQRRQQEAEAQREKELAQQQQREAEEKLRRAEAERQRIELKKQKQREEQERRAAEEKKRLEAEQRRQRAAEAQLQKELAERQEREAQEKQRNEMTITLAPGVEMVFRRVPAGEFWMGSEDNDIWGDCYAKPQHKVHLDEYWIGKYPVTNAQYQAYVNANKIAGWKFEPGKEQHPAVNVSWEDATGFCKWASLASGRNVRLPTEAEWEKAARGTDKRLFPWGNQPPDKSRANYCDIRTTTPVGQFSPQGDSPYGCADMAGNVYDWIADWYSSAYYRNQSSFSNPTGPSSGTYKAIRGGSLLNIESSLRTAGRGSADPGNRHGDLGFRCAVPPAP